MSGADHPRCGDVALQWVKHAERDILGVKACLDAPQPVPEISAYLCQQSTEKLVKALLVLAEVPFPKTHDLQAFRRLAAPVFPDQLALIDDLVALTDWGVAFRYPDLTEEPVPSAEEIRSALRKIEDFSARVRSLLGQTRA